MLKTILKTVLLIAVGSVFVGLAALFMIDRYKTYRGERLFFQQYYEQHKED